ncbi:MAG: hypothetical protein HKM93_10940 [Desulfobacteraceae bacterium]|nr:hypothetical protein [Desulfobacteraceae bacterium]
MNAKLTISGSTKVPRANATPFLKSWILMTAVISFLVIFFSNPSVVAADEDRFFNFSRPITVMTQNLYVGADIFKLFSADPNDPEDPLQVPRAVAEILTDIHETGFPQRADAMAGEIARYRPDVIGLQEVSLIRTQTPSDLDPVGGNQSPAQTVLYDYLDILITTLAEKGLNYKIAAVIENADVELPALTGIDNGQPVFTDVRLTDRDAVLVRHRVKTTNVVARHFSTNLSIPFGSDTITFKRGFIALDAKIKGRVYRIANTHLEVQGQGYEMIQSAQAQELINQLIDSRKPVVLIGDFNSGPNDAEMQPYHLLSAAGFADAWERRWGRPDPGYTCCQEPDLLNAVSFLDERIDQIWVRNAISHLPITITGPIFMKLVGDDSWDKTIDGLWPSDHAGVNAWLMMPYFKKNTD